MQSLENYLGFGLGPETFAEFAQALSQVTHRRRACELPGLCGHQAFLALRQWSARSCGFWKIIYRNDVLSKCSLIVPSLG